MRAARAMVSSVPSIASTATQARSEITTVWPMSIAVIWRATRKAVGDVLGFVRIGSALSDHARFGNERLQK